MYITTVSCSNGLQEGCFEALYVRSIVEVQGNIDIFKSITFFVITKFSIPYIVDSKCYC